MKKYLLAHRQIGLFGPTYTRGQKSQTQWQKFCFFNDFCFYSYFLGRHSYGKTANAMKRASFERPSCFGSFFPPPTFPVAIHATTQILITRAAAGQAGQWRLSESELRGPSPDPGPQSRHPLVRCGALSEDWRGASGADPFRTAALFVGVSRSEPSSGSCFAPTFANPRSRQGRRSQTRHPQKKSANHTCFSPQRTEEASLSQSVWNRPGTMARNQSSCAESR